LHGEWPTAFEEIQRACECLADPPQRAVGAAYYQWAELLRLRGEFARAEDMYRQAGQTGRSPQPGLSLLRLAQGLVDLAAAAIRNVLGEAKEPRVRSRMLPAYVEIMLAADDLAAAREGADELRAITATLDAPFLRAVSAHAHGATLVAEGEARSALIVLREASAAWDDIEAPYEAARTRRLIGDVFKRLGDQDSANIELEAARQAFKRLGAAPDVARMEAASGRPASISGLSARELEVLQALATGKTNRSIADELCISEKTVARHVSNIFNKLGLSSRAAATAYAYEHHLV
jgi:DNA-binding NarL/FixJ family response regulator